MLGQKRNKSLFIENIEDSKEIPESDNKSLVNNEESEKEKNKETSNIQYSADNTEIQNKDISVEREEINISSNPPRELGSDNRTHSLFFTPESEGKDFSSVLKDVQEYISNNYSILITDETIEDSKEHLKRYISKYVQDKRISVRGMDGNKLIDALYSEMAEFGFLTKYIHGDGIEEIDINSWKDIEIQY
ncbi:MAG TPA: hypothetical protein VFC79_00070, partial [Tissierellaceae bacterium]|nr:hypothetical protein [Tissierellaceae bacterium]